MAQDPRKANGRAAFKLCGNCKVTRYCSTTCQKKDWPTHKDLCKKGIHITNIDSIIARTEDINSKIYGYLRKPILSFRDEPDWGEYSILLASIDHDFVVSVEDDYAVAIHIAKNTKWVGDYHEFKEFADSVVQVNRFMDYFDRAIWDRSTVLMVIVNKYMMYFMNYNETMNNKNLFMIGEKSDQIDLFRALITDKNILLSDSFSKKIDAALKNYQESGNQSISIYLEGGYCSEFDPNNKELPSDRNFVEM